MSKRVIYISLIILIWWLICGFMIIKCMNNKVSDKYEISEYSYYIIQYGDSLNEICGRYIPANIDFSHYRELVIEFNNKNNYDIYEGDTLMVPTVIHKKNKWQ